MIKPSLQLTFGVEFEAILAFHETLLQTHLFNTNNASKIIKYIPDNIRSKLNQTSYHYLNTHKRYMGWGLTTPPTFTLSDHIFEEKLEDQMEKGGYRGYAGEILQLAKELLPERVRVHDSFQFKFEDFASWHLTHDRSVVGMDKDTLQRELSLAGQKVDDINDWDSHGIELVSRVLPFEEASFEEINIHLAALLGNEDSKHAAFINENCGFHVHIGLPGPKDLVRGTPPPTFSLATVQHLAYILVMYEMEISKSFPAHRREGSAAALVDLQTNLDNFIEEPKYDVGDMDEPWDESKQ